MKKLNQFFLLIALAAPLPFLSGCIPIVVAAAGGAGYLVSSPDAVQKIDAYFIDLDKSIQKKFDRTSTASETKKKINYKEGQGLVIELIGCEISPKEVKPGEKVTVTIQYAVMGASPDKGIEIEESKTLWFGDEQAAVLANEKVARKNGTWESVITFLVPDKVQIGKYKVKNSITSNDKVIQTFESFEIATNK